ncbi:lipoate-protein ligase [Anaeramoeba flamelloides]|uniref:lipoate--protein ligase n=1 Tax=Anaeramoeba flamelloides TaxID=1746091 RepID=A0AAV8AGJ1_9EUKA|nr:lipoate-protein ligase [Anaeramoeba flamelloides]
MLSNLIPIKNHRNLNCRFLAKQIVLRNLHSKIRVLRSNQNNPFLNLAIEEWLLKDSPVSKPTLYLWRNSPTVVIGKHQNPWKECNLEAMRQNGVNLARRESGGGAVYQDLGNTNFTFLVGRKDFSKEANNSIIVRALSHFGIKAEVSGRNDLTVDQKKISGSAYKLTNERAFHHGTMLMNVDLKALGKYLTVNKLKLQSKGVKSVRSRVSNLIEYNKEIEHEGFCKATIEEFWKHYDDHCEIETIGKEIITKIPKIQNYFNHLKDWDWRFGHTPKFNLEFEKKFDWGLISVGIISNDGKIKKVKIFSDSLYPGMITALENCLSGTEINKQKLKNAIENAKKSSLVENSNCFPLMDQFCSWLVTTI